MMLYFKINAGALEQYIDQIRRSDFRGVALSIDRFLSESRNWVLDDIDYPEAVEAAEILAFYKQECDIDETRLDGQRWITSECLGRIHEMCLKYNKQVLGVLITLINHSPYPDAEYVDIDD